LTKKKELPPKVKCPDCDAEYPTNKGLSAHRRSAHGYVSMKPTALWQRNKKLKKAAKPVTPAISTISTNELQCDQCDFVARTSSALVWHRIKQHTPRKALKCDQCDFVAKYPGGLKWHKHRLHAAADELKCDQCDFVAKWKGGLTHHKRAAHTETVPVELTRKSNRREIDNSEKAKAIVIHAAATTSNGHQETHVAPDGIPEAVIAIGLGRFQELSRSLAFEHDLPPRMFAARLAGLIYATTVR
jgi:uncharacterized C2H2 Zn-finger protein